MIWDWLSPFPDDVRAQLEPIFEEWAWLVPPSVYRVAIFWVPEPDASHPCWMSQQPHYREAKICFGPLWLTSVDREADVLHEICHLFNNTLYREALNVLEDIVPDVASATYKLAAGALDDALEACNSDLTHVLANRRRLTSAPR